MNGIKKHIFVLAIAMTMLAALPAVASAAGYVMVDGNQYNTVEDAIKFETSDTYEIYGRLEVSRGGFDNAGNATFIGKNDEAEIVVNPKSGGDSYGKVGNVTFKNLTFTTNNVNYKGFHQAASETFINCKINGEYWTYKPATFTNCEFNQSESGQYNVWVYGSDSVKFEKCDFNAAGRFVLVYNEGFTGINATLENCKFIANENFDATANEAAVESDPTRLAGSRKHNVSMKNCEIDCRIPAAFRDRSLGKGIFDTCGNQTTFTPSGNIQLHHVNGDCGHVIADEGVASVALPKTGDNSHLLFFAVLLALSVVGLMVCRRRSER